MSLFALSAAWKSTTTFSGERRDQMDNKVVIFCPYCHFEVLVTILITYPEKETVKFLGHCENGHFFKWVVKMMKWNELINGKGEDNGHTP